MLVYSSGFLALALTAALLGYTGIAWGALGIALVSLVVCAFTSVTVLALQGATSKRPAPLL